MHLHALAEALRQRLRDQKLVDEEIMARVSDFDIIDSYITCSCCGEKSVETKEKLLATVALAKNVEQWLDMTSPRQLH